MNLVKNDRCQALSFKKEVCRMLHQHVTLEIQPPSSAPKNKQSIDHLGQKTYSVAVFKGQVMEAIAQNTWQNC